MKEIDDSKWDKESIERLYEFEHIRNYVIRATRLALKEFYDENLRGDEKVLEIGSGTGFLRRTLRCAVDRFEGEWVQLDPQIAFLEEAEKMLPEQYVCGSVYELPFKDETFDIVIGLSSFDVFYEFGKSGRRNIQSAKT